MIWSLWPAVRANWTRNRFEGAAGQDLARQRIEKERLGRVSGPLFFVRCVLFASRRCVTCEHSGAALRQIMILMIIDINHNAAFVLLRRARGRQEMDVGRDLVLRCLYACDEFRPAGRKREVVFA